MMAIPVRAELVCLVVFSAVVFMTKLLVDSIVPEMYMDEVFHVPQAQAIYHGNYTWDPKITTPPCLYFVSRAILTSFSLLKVVEETCTVLILRQINSIFLVLSYIVLYVSISMKNLELSNLNIAFAALTVVIFPLHFFFGFLYYTDVLSTLLVLAMSNFRLQRKPVPAAMCGAAAVFTRQTNIVWVLMEIILRVWEVFETDMLPAIHDLWNPPPPAPPVKRGRGRPSLKPKPLPPVPEKPNFIKLWVKLFKKVFPDVLGYGLVVVGFLAFVCTNGGVALGDKEAHQLVINFPQFLYFAMFCTAFMSPVFVLTVGSTAQALRKGWFYFVLACLVGLVVVHYNTVAHPYLLADNRHFTFYIWKRLFEWYPVFRYALVPFAMISWTAIITNLDLSAAMRFSYLCAIFGLLVPHLLLEFRYFIVPYYVLRLNFSQFEWKVIVPEFVLYLLVNLITIHLFLYKPFLWQDSDEVQRFMW